MSTTHGPIKRLWWRWRSLRLPWRRRWLVGFDLAGNTFWEFTDKLNVGRYRRIVQYTRKVHYADVKVAPQWMQWLRHTRADPPSINEQQLDEIRQAHMKQLAAQADARWASKPSALDPPSRQQPQPQPGAFLRAPADAAPMQIAPELKSGVRNPATSQGKTVQSKDSTAAEDKRRVRPAASQSSSPWKGLKLGKEGEQQPESWVPSPARRR